MKISTDGSLKSFLKNLPDNKSSRNLFYFGHLVHFFVQITKSQVRFREGHVPAIIYLNSVSFLVQLVKFGIDFIAIFDLFFLAKFTRAIKIPTFFEDSLSRLVTLPVSIITKKKSSFSLSKWDYLVLFSIFQQSVCLIWALHTEGMRWSFIRQY